MKNKKTKSFFIELIVFMAAFLLNTFSIYLCVGSLGVQEADFQNALIIKNNKTSKYNLSFGKIQCNYSDWSNYPYKNLLIDNATQWYGQNNENMSFLYTQKTNDFSGVSVGDGGSNVINVSVFGCPHVGATGEFYGFTLLPDFFWDSNVGDQAIYLSESLAEKLKLTKSGDSCDLFVNRALQSSMTVFGICKPSSLPWLSDLLDNDFIILPYNSAYRKEQRSGDSSYISTFSSEYFQNTTYLSTFNTIKKSDTNIKVSFHKDEISIESEDFNDSLGSYRKNIPTYNGLIFVLCFMVIILLFFIAIKTKKMKSKKKDDIFAKTSSLAFVITIFVMLLLVFFPNSLIFYQSVFIPSSSLQLSFGSLGNIVLLLIFSFPRQTTKDALFISRDSTSSRL
jgi:hypothetical protein